MTDYVVLESDTISGLELCRRLRNRIDRHPCGCQTRWDEALWRSVDVLRCAKHEPVAARFYAAAACRRIAGES